MPHGIRFFVPARLPKPLRGPGGLKMLAAMVERIFLGWDQPFLGKAVTWLLERRDELPGLQVVVPTAQSGRRLREALAGAAGALLSPQVVTPGSFLKLRDDEAAADWMERVAWVEVLESVADWQDYAALFPEPPDAGALAREFTRLRHALQENGLSLAMAARKLAGSAEPDRWEALGRLEDLVERKLQSWGLRSRTRILAEGLELPSEAAGIVLAGVADLPPLVERALVEWGGKVTVLIGAPEELAADFSPLGRPLAVWSEKCLPWPDGSVQVLADPRQQAVEALRVTGEAATPSDELALGTADTGTGDELARAFTRDGWPAFHPAATPVTGGLARWFGIWRGWLAEPSLAVLADLLALPETGILVSGKRAQKARRLAELRDSWMVVLTTDLRRRIERETFRSERDEEAARELLQAVDALESWRGSFLGGDFSATLGRLLEILARTGAAADETAAAMGDWLTEAEPLLARVKRGPEFWIELMLSEIQPPPPQPPDGRVIDVQGWLELFHESGRHLVLCGMNEGKVPARGGGEPWLSEAAREWLGLTKDADRAARDAYLYTAMLEARRDGGRVDVFCGKTGAGGETLLPSRLLLAAKRDELPARVKLLFREVEPPEAGLRWHADWQWQVPAAPPPVRLNVTSLGTYLECPFRYYLKHVTRMQGSEPGRAEWNPRDFGNVAHEVLERWGRDTEAREFEKTEAIHDWLSAELDRVVAEWFGKRVPLAVRIQTEALRQRFLWLARAQAISRVEGWEIIDVERKIEIPAGEALIVAKIDRIDRHRDSGRLRVLDYKTGQVDSVDKAHRRKITAATVLPLHLSQDCPAIYAGADGGKSVDFRWYNLQLPLYAAALVNAGDPMPTPCYFKLGSTRGNVEILTWEHFEDADLAAANDCAAWIAGQIAGGVFWPPAARVTYDDYGVLAAGRGLEEMFLAPAAASGVSA